MCGLISVCGREALACRKMPLDAVASAKTAAKRWQASSAFEILRPYDDDLAATLTSGAILLIDASYLRIGGLSALARRQELEERAEQPHIFMRPAAAAAALRAADRRVCFLTHCWRSSQHPDPDGATCAALLRFLRHPLGAHVVGVFVDYASMHQAPRSPEQQNMFNAALSAIVDGYASPLGTTVAKFSIIPACTAETAATIGIHGPPETARAAVDAAIARANGHIGMGSLEFIPAPQQWSDRIGTRGRHGDQQEDAAAVTVLLDVVDEDPYEAAVSVACGPAPQLCARARIKVNECKQLAEPGVWRAELRSAAEAAKVVAKLQAWPEAAGLGEGAHAFRWYNDTPYSQRGWTTLESAASGETVARVVFSSPHAATALAQLPAKVIEIGGATPTAVAQEGADVGGARSRIERIRAALRDPAQTHFSAQGDRELVVKMFTVAMVAWW